MVPESVPNVWVAVSPASDVDALIALFAASVSMLLPAAFETVEATEASPLPEVVFPVNM